MSSATGIYVFITTIVQGLQYVFTPIEVVTQGGPNYASSNLIYMSYHEAFTLYRTGTSSAVSVITMVLFIVLLLLEFRFVEKGYTMKIKRNAAGWHLLLLCAVFLILMPIVFAVSNSFKTMQDAFNTVFQIIPARPTVQNYIHVFSKLPFLRITMNTFLIAATVTAFKTVTSLFAAYSFVYFDFRGKGILYFIMLATMFIPFTVTMIPNYLMISKIGLSDKIWGVALPQLADVLGIFLLRQSMRESPGYIEAARMNVKNLKIMRDIIIPLVRPSIISTGIIFSSNSLEQYVWPVLILKSKENYTPVPGLQMYISAEGGTEFTSNGCFCHDHGDSAGIVYPVPALYHQYLCHVGNQGLGSWRPRESNKEKSMKNIVFDHE